MFQMIQKGKQDLLEVKFFKDIIVLLHLKIKLHYSSSSMYFIDHRNKLEHHPMLLEKQKHRFAFQHAQ
jgi:hypothetical protein